MENGNKKIIMSGEFRSQQSSLSCYDKSKILIDNSFFPFERFHRKMRFYEAGYRDVYQNAFFVSGKS